MSKLQEDDDFKRLQSKLYTLRSNRLTSWPWGGIELLKDKSKVKIDRKVLEAMMDELQEATDFRESLISFLRLRDLVEEEASNAARHEISLCSLGD